MARLSHVCPAASGIVHAELFHDHQRIARMLLDGAREPRGGVLRPDPAAPGLGLELRSADAEPHRVA